MFMSPRSPRPRPSRKNSKKPVKSSEFKTKTFGSTSSQCGTFIAIDRESWKKWCDLERSLHQNSSLPQPRRIRTKTTESSTRNLSELLSGIHLLDTRCRKITSILKPTCSSVCPSSTSHGKYLPSRSTSPKQRGHT